MQECSREKQARYKLSRRVRKREPLEGGNPHAPRNRKSIAKLCEDELTSIDTRITFYPLELNKNPLLLNRKNEYDE